MGRGRPHDEDVEIDEEARNNEEANHSITVISKGRMCNWAKVAIFFIFLSTTFIILFVLFPTSRIVEWFIPDTPKNNLTNSTNITNTTNSTRYLDEFYL